MLTIGLIGGIASGKSTVAQLLEERGAAVFDADRYAHHAIDTPGVRDALVERWGPGVLTSTGSVNRALVAEKVFGMEDSAEQERRFLESLVHPDVRRRLDAALHQHAESGGQVAVLDVPLLIEAGWQDEVDLIVLVDTPQDSRLAWAASRGWDESELAWREGSQLPISEKRRHADAIIKNSAGLDELNREVAAFWEELVKPRTVDLG